MSNIWVVLAIGLSPFILIVMLLLLSIFNQKALDRLSKYLLEISLIVLSLTILTLLIENTVRHRISGIEDELRIIKIRQVKIQDEFSKHMLDPIVPHKHSYVDGLPYTYALECEKWCKE